MISDWAKRPSLGLWGDQASSAAACVFVRDRSTPILAQTVCSVHPADKRPCRTQQGLYKGECLTAARCCATRCPAEHLRAASGSSPPADSAPASFCTPQQGSAACLRGVSVWQLGLVTASLHCAAVRCAALRSTRVRPQEVPSSC